MILSSQISNFYFYFEYMTNVAGMTSLIIFVNGNGVLLLIIVDNLK